jgi:hypothetical protein
MIKRGQTRLTKPQPKPQPNPLCEEGQAKPGKSQQRGKEQKARQNQERPEINDLRWAKSEHHSGPIESIEITVHSILLREHFHPSL